MRIEQRTAAINPYVGWAQDHPACLLPSPSPEGLRQLREKSGRPARRVLVDLGCGAGQFISCLAAASPWDDCIGFELRYKRLVKSARKLERAGIANAWLVRDEAGRFADYFDPASIDTVFVNFPDPWPRASQWKKRLLNHALLDALETMLRPEGRLCVKTDHAGYFLHVLALIHSRPTWRVADFSNNLHGRGRPLAGCPEAGVETEFEQLFRSKRKAVFAAVLTHGIP